MVKKNAKRFLSILLSAVIVFSLFSMNISAAEENVASIGDTYYNSVAEALSAAVSGDTVIVRKDTTITENVEVKSGVTLLVPHKDGYTGYNVASGNPDVNSSATDYVTDVLYRTLTVAEGVTVTVNGNILVSALIGLKKSGHYRHEVNGNYAQMILNGKINVNNGGVVVANGYIKGSGAIEAFSGAEVRDLFVIEHFRGGTHSSYMRTQGVWIANEYDFRNITVEVTIHYGAEFTAQNVAYFNSSFSYNVVPFVGSSDGIFILKEGSKLVRTVEYRDRIGKEAEVYRLYGGGYLGSISIKIYISILPVTVNSSSFVMAMDGDNEFHLYDGEYDSYYNSKAISLKFLPGSELIIHDGAIFKANRYKTSARDRYSQIVAYRELTDSQFAANYRYPQGRPAAKIRVENGGTLYVDGELGGEIYLAENAIVTKGDNAVFSVTTKESAKLQDKSTETYTNDAEFIVPDEYHVVGWNESNQLTWEKHTYGEAVATTAPTCTAAGKGTKTCTFEGCDASIAATIPATGHNYQATVTAPTCTAQGYTTHKCANCGDSYKDTYVAASGHSYTSEVTAPDCENKGYTTYTCGVCGDTYVNNYVDALGHTEKTETIPATCTKAGTETVSCTVCGETISETEIPALEHSYSDWNITDATCTETGTKTKTCSLCGDVVSESIPVAGHSYTSEVTAPDCENKGYTTYICGVCSDTYVNNYVDALGHTEKTETIPATCTKAGTETVSCTVCGEIISETEISAPGHTEVIDEAVDADCENKGLTEGKHCSVCSEVIVAQKETPALGHTDGDWVVTKTPTLTETGEETLYCSVCGEAIDTREIAGIDLKTNRIHMTAEGDNITFTSCVNAHNIAFYAKTSSGSDVFVETEGTPIGKTGAGDRYVVYYKDWKNAGEKCETTLTVDGKTYNLSIVFETRALETEDIVIYEKYAKANVDNDNKIVTLVAPLTSREITFNEVSKQCKEFSYTIESDENISYAKEENKSFGAYTIAVDEPTTLTKKMVVNKGRYCEEEYTLKVIFKDVQEIDYLRTIRSTLSMEIDETGEEYISVNLQSGKTAAGIYKEVISDEIESFVITTTDGTLLEREDAYVAYVSQNTSDVYGTIVFTMADGTTKEYKVVFDLGLGEPTHEIPELDIIGELKLIRASASLSEDGKVVITLAEGKNAAGVYTLTNSGYTVKIEAVNGKFANRTDAYVAYQSSNTANVEGTMTVTLADGTVYEYAVIFDLGL